MKKPICDKCKKPIWEAHATEGDRMLTALAAFAFGDTQRPYGFCRCGALTKMEGKTMQRCPSCGDSIQINLPRDTDLVDLSRQNKRNGGVGVVQCEGCGYEGDPLEFDTRSLLPKVVRCYITRIGKVIAYDAEGRQVPECQGFFLMVASQLKIRCDENTLWFLDYAERESLNFAWWFKNDCEEVKQMKQTFCDSCGAEITEVRPDKVHSNLWVVMDEYMVKIDITKSGMVTDLCRDCRTKIVTEALSQNYPYFGLILDGDMEVL